MALVFAAIAALLTLVCAAMVFFADAMSDAPGAQGLSVGPVFIVGGIIVGVLLIVHFMRLPL